VFDSQLRSAIYCITNSNLSDVQWLRASLPVGDDGLEIKRAVEFITALKLTDQRSYSTLDPVSARMGDRLRAGKLSRYVTSHQGQLSLAIPLWEGEMSTSLGWEGNRRSGVALAMRQSIVVYPPTGSTAYESEMSIPLTLLQSMALLLPLPFTVLHFYS